MKISITKMTAAVAGLVAMAGVAQATLIQETYSGPNIDIADGNPVGIANSFNNVSDPGNAAIEDVSVNLNISGGYDGDLYGYLVYNPSSSAVTAGSVPEMVVLLNQIGTTGSNPFGDATAGMNVTLSDSGAAGIHNQTGTALTSGAGVYKPDSTSTFDSTFTGSADGTWTLFLADLSAGGGTGDSQLVSWQLNISVVPEPVTWALAGFAGVLGLVRFMAWRKQVKSA